MCTKEVFLGVGLGVFCFIALWTHSAQIRSSPDRWSVPFTAGLEAIAGVLTVKGRAVTGAHPKFGHGIWRLRSRRSKAVQSKAERSKAARQRLVEQAGLGRGRARPEAEEGRRPKAVGA